MSRNSDIRSIFTTLRAIPDMNQGNYSALASAYSDKMRNFGKLSRKSREKTHDTFFRSLTALILRQSIIVSKRYDTLRAIARQLLTLVPAMKTNIEFQSAVSLCVMTLYNTKERFKMARTAILRNFSHNMQADTMSSDLEEAAQGYKSFMNVARQHRERAEDEVVKLLVAMIGDNIKSAKDLSRTIVGKVMPFLSDWMIGRLDDAYDVNNNKHNNDNSMFVGVSNRTRFIP